MHSIEKHQSTFLLDIIVTNSRNLSVCRSTGITTYSFNKLVFHDVSVVLMNVTLLPFLKKQNTQIQNMFTVSPYYTVHVLNMLHVTPIFNYADRQCYYNTTSSSSTTIFTVTTIMSLLLLMLFCFLCYCSILPLQLQLLLQLLLR